MKFWKAIVDKSLLGSAKMPLQPGDLPPMLLGRAILPSAMDTEESFLKLTSLAYQYRQSGAMALDMSTIASTTSESEEFPFASLQSTAIARSILAEELFALLGLWLHRMEAKQVVAEPELIPELLDIAAAKKEFRKQITKICGKRGEWLSQLNPTWNFYTTAPDTETLWQTGKPEERRELLRELRLKQDDKARTLVQSTWSEEGANEKAAFLELFKINLSATDLEWLESLKEKAQKVNALILELLKSIPDSTIVQTYWGSIQNAVQIKTDKALLGMISKTYIDIEETVSVPETIFKTGIESLSSNKGITDQQHILYQLMASVPPSYWNTHLNETPANLIELMQKNKKSAFYLTALASAAIRFNDQRWISDLLTHADANQIVTMTVPLVQALPPGSREPFVLRFFTRKPHEFIAMMLEQEQEWSLPMARTILTFTALEVFTYNRTFYKPAVVLIPVQLLNELDSFTPADEQKKPYWRTQSDELSRLLDLKKQILQSI